MRISCGKKHLLLTLMIQLICLAESQKVKRSAERDDNRKFGACRVNRKIRQPCVGNTETECNANGCCWDRRRKNGGCYKPKVQLPRNCQESYSNGNTKSGIHQLQTHKNQIFDVYCLFINGKTGFLFPSRSAIDEIADYDLILSTLTSERSHMMVLQRHKDGSTSEANVKPLPAYERIGLNFIQNKWEKFSTPYRRDTFGEKFIYAGFLNTEQYAKKRHFTLGFTSNGRHIMYHDCDGTPNNYMAFYTNMENATLCETGWTMGSEFLTSFKPSTHGAVMDHDDYWFTMESNFGGCGMRYSSACSGIHGYAIGLPFGMKQGQCRCNGYLHCHSFDDRKLNFFGSCRYLAAQDGCEGGIYQNHATFRVIADFFRKRDDQPTWVKTVFVDIVGHGRISLGKRNRVTVAGVAITNFPAVVMGGVVISKSFNLVVVRLPSGVSVSWAAYKRQFTIDVPGALQNQVCGLCGNFNGDQEDDWIMGDETVCPKVRTEEGKITTNANKFGISWLTAQDLDTGCAAECDDVHEVAPLCEGAAAVQAKAHCALLHDQHLFEPCVGEIPQSQIDDLLSECEYDTCLVGDPDNELLCTHVELLAELCRDTYGVNISGWRNDSFCPITCPDHMEYKSCGSQDQRTCFDPTGIEGGACQEGCFCVDGYVSDGDGCIRLDQCGCVWEGVMYKVGDTILTPDCSETCTCHADHPEMMCTKSDCARNSMCTIIDEFRQCVCPPTSIMITSSFNRQVCQPITAKCRGVGDPHFVSFDQSKFKFMGSCQYTMVQDGCQKGVATSEPTFKLVGDLFRKDPTTHVSYIGGMYLYFMKNQKISFKGSGEVLVDGTRINHFPARLPSGVVIKKHNTLLRVSLPNQVTFTYIPHEERFAINAPSTLRAKLCGLCGNFNNNPDDDFIMGAETCENKQQIPGEIAATSTRFGVSWRSDIDDDFRCSDECEHIGDPDPECPIADQQIAKDHCKELYDANGRFQDCVVLMDPRDLAELVSDCEYDTCMTGDPDSALLCVQAAVLVELCRDKYKVRLAGWRNPHFCPLTCPPNMEYQDCGSVCKPTCDDLNATRVCTEPCMEGCFCKEGFLFDGDSCILPKECGCVKDGLIYEIGESFMTPDCSQTCTCPGSGADMVCKPSGCHENSTCTIVDGSRECMCRAPLIGDGRNCTLIKKKEEDKEAFPCEANPPTCVIVHRGPCKPVRKNQKCGVGAMMEKRHCYATALRKGTHVIKTVTRKCCIERCPLVDRTGLPRLGDDDDPKTNVYCRDVFPECEED